MKQAHKWLLIIAALVLLPSVALAQPKKPGGGAKPAPAPQGGASTAGSGVGQGVTTVLELEEHETFLSLVTRPRDAALSSLNRLS